jgi:hypothetical protein
MTNLFERDTKSLIEYVLAILFGNVGRDVAALLMHDPDGVAQLPSQRAFEQVARGAGLQCLRLLREAASAVETSCQIISVRRSISATRERR